MNGAHDYFLRQAEKSTQKCKIPDRIALPGTAVFCVIVFEKSPGLLFQGLFCGRGLAGVIVTKKRFKYIILYVIMKK